MLLSWAVDGKHDSSLSAWSLPPRSLESGVVRGIGEIGGLSPRVPFLDRRRSGPLGHRGGYMGPCNEKTLTGPACSVMKVLQSCEWKHTSFMLLSRCLSHRLPLIHSKSKRGEEEEMRPRQQHAVSNIHLREMRREFLMKQRVEVIYTRDSEPVKVQPEEQSHLSLSGRLKSRCCLQRWTMMYVLHFSFGWGHRLHKCLRQVWYFNLFLVRGMLGLCPINTQGNRLAKISHGSVSLFCLEAEMSTRIAPLNLKLKYGRL